MAKPKEEFQATAEEVEQLSNALKKEEFRKLFFDYCQEISDPESKKRYEAELIELEKMRGVDMKFLEPTPGFVLKTVILPASKEKLFVNMCSNENLDRAHAKMVRISSSKMGENWSIPYSITHPRKDHDKEKNKCTVVDAMFHPDTYKKAQENSRFKQLLIDTALDGIEERFNIRTDRKKAKTLKIPYKGIQPQTVIRLPKEEMKDRPQNVDLGGLPLQVPYPPLKDSSAKPKKPAKEKKIKKPSEPQYNIVYSGEFTMQDFTNNRESSRVKRPKNLIVTVVLPGVESASAVDLDIYEKRLTLECAKPLYKLDLALSYPIDSDKGSAKFNKSKSTLTVTLPVLPPPVEQHNLTPPRPLITELTPPKELISELEPKTQSAEEAESSNETKEEGSCDLSSEESANQNEDVEPDTAVSTNGIESKRSHDIRSGNDWTSTGEWYFPPFSHRQDESNVTFVLHTRGVKEKSIVANFDQSFAHLTYRTTAGKSYSFYVGFGDGCSVEIDDCVVDVSDDNIVVLCTKESKGLWEKFTVGLNAEQTYEKLFLTEANVHSAIEEMERFLDPWTTKAKSPDSAQVKVVSQSESHLDIEVVDKPTASDPSSDTIPQQSPSESKDVDTERSDPSTGDSQTKQSSPPDDIPEQTSSPQLQEGNPNSGDDLPQDSNADLSQSSASSDEFSQLGCAVPHNMPQDSSSQSSSSISTEEVKADPKGMTGGSYVKVEADGSMFVRADADYVESRAQGKVTLGVEAKNEGGIQLSNKLMFSLD